MGVSLTCLFVMMISFNYVDGNSYISWSIELLDRIFGKTEMEFYEYSALNLHTNDAFHYGCDKSILMILPLAIWNIPVWIVHQITGEMIVTGIWDIVWMKFGFLLCIVITAVESAKIVRIIRPDADTSLVYPLLFGSFDVICSTMYASQDEIVYILTLIVAMRHIINNKVKWFLVFSAITVALNPEMVIPILLMILFQENRLLIIMLELLVSVAPMEMFNIIYRNNDAYNEVRVVGDNLVKSLFSADIGLKMGENTVSLFLVVVCLLLFYAFSAKKEKSKSEDLIWIIALVMISMTLLSTGGYINYFYRSIMYVPFIIILILISNQNININLVLYLLYSWCRSWLCICTNIPQNMSTWYITYNNDFTQRILDKSGVLILGQYYGDKYPIIADQGVLSVVCLSLAIVLFFINYGDNQKKRIDMMLNKDIIVFVSGLFVLVVLAAFGWMIVRSDKYERLIKFGSNNIAYNEEELGELCYVKNNGIISILGLGNGYYYDKHDAFIFWWLYQLFLQKLSLCSVSGNSYCFIKTKHKDQLTFIWFVYVLQKLVMYWSRISPKHVIKLLKS